MLTLLRPLRKLFDGNRPYVLALIVLNVFFFSDVLFTDNTFFYRDIGNFHQPLRKLVTEAYSRGEWPLWNPYVQFGQPLLANPNSMAFYPTQLLFHLFPFDLAFDLNLVLHCLIGGLGAFYLARALNLSPIAAFAAAIAYNFNGVMLSLINVPLLAAIGGLVPWLGLLLRKIMQGPSRANLAVASLLFGLLLLLLEPLTTYGVFLFLVPFGLYSFLTRPAGVSRRRVAVGLLIVLVSGFCLAGIQILPTTEMVQNAGREKGLPFDAVTFWSVHPLSLTQMLFPQVWKDAFDLTRIRSGWSMAFFDAREPYIVSCYAGLSCLIIALLALFFSEQRRLKWTLFCVLLATVILALGKYTPIYSLLFRYVPPFRLGRYPAKYLLTTAMCFSLLAGLGIEQLRQLGCQLQASARKRRLVVYFVVIGGLLAGSSLLAGDWLWQRAGFRVVNDVVEMSYQGQLVNLNLSLVRHSILYLVIVLAAGLLLVYFAAGSRERASWVAVAATGLIFFDLLTNHSINPLVRSEAYGRSPVTQWLVTHTPTKQPCRVYHLSGTESPYQILGKTDSLIWSFLFRRLTASPYTAAGDHIQYSSFMPIDRLEPVSSQMIDERLRAAPGLAQKLDYLASLNTGYVLSMNPIRSPVLEWQISFDLNSDRLLHVYRLTSAVPRAFVAELETIGPSRAGQKPRYYLSPENAKGRSGSRLADQSAQLTRYTAGEVDLWAIARKPSMLILLDSHYPGWRAWVDGHECKVEVVQHTFRGVIIQPGQHHVKFRYDPRSFRYGGVLSLSTVGVWLVALMFLHFRRNRRVTGCSCSASSSNHRSPPATLPESPHTDLTESRRQ